MTTPWWIRELQERMKKNPTFSVKQQKEIKEEYHPSARKIDFISGMPGLIGRPGTLQKKRRKAMRGLKLRFNANKGKYRLVRR